MIVIHGTIPPGLRLGSRGQSGPESGSSRSTERNLWAVARGGTNAAIADCTASG
jgi:hypothetical protein